MRRVMIIGPGGAGKSTLARRLGDRTGLPVHRLDRAYWLPNWVEADRDAFDAKHDALTAGERWIIDGNYGRTLGRRAARADTIVLLDLPPWRCVASAIGRRIKNHGRVRADMGSGCVEAIDLAFLRWIWRFRVDTLPGLLATIEPCRATKTIHHFRSRRAAYAWLGSLPPTHGDGE